MCNCRAYAYDQVQLSSNLAIISGRTNGEAMKAARYTICKSARIVHCNMNFIRRLDSYHARLAYSAVEKYMINTVDLSVYKQTPHRLTVSVHNQFLPQLSFLWAGSGFVKESVRSKIIPRYFG